MRFFCVLALVSFLLCGGPAFADLYLEDGMLNISSREVKWALQFPAKDCALKMERHTKDGRGHYYFFNTSDPGFNVSFYIEPADKCKTAPECRDGYINQNLKQPNPAIEKPQNIRNFDLNGFSAVEFFVPEAKGIKADQFNFSAHHVRDGYWVDLHVSKTGYRPEQREKLADFVSSISFKADKAAAFAGGDPITAREFPVPGGGALVFDMPRSWTPMIGVPPREGPPTFMVKPRTGDDFKLFVTPIGNPAVKGPVSPQKVRDLAAAAAKDAAPQAVEKDLPLREIKRESGSAYYFFATDKAPPEGEYLYVVQGAIGADDVLVAVTFLCRKKELAGSEAVLKLFATGRKRN